MPAGNHPLLDPCWSSEALEFVHDGLEATRIEKVRLIAQDERALGWLRVCVRPTEDSLNCGRCEKCLRTMINLHAVGALERCPMFPSKIEPRRIARLDVVNVNHQVFFEQNIRALKERPSDARIVRALQTAIKRSHFRRDLREIAMEWLPGPFRMVRRLYRAAGRAAASEGEPHADE
jgi:hypothetical protein